MLAAFVESGINDSLSSAQVLYNDVSYTVDGRLSSQTDLDFYTFYAAEGSTLDVRARAIFDGAPPDPEYQLDPIVAIYAPGQTSPLQVDDDGGGTQAVPWTAVSSASVTVSGFWTVAVTRYDDFDIIGISSPEDETPGRNTGRYRLTINGAERLEIDPSKVVAQHDISGNGNHVFGTYLPNVALENEFTVGLNINLPSSLAIRYEFVGAGSEKTAARVGQDHVFTQNMGLIVSPQPILKIKLVHTPSGKSLASYQAAIVFQTSLTFELHLDHGSGLVPHNTVRFIGSEIIEPAWPAEARLASSLPFFDLYKSEPLSLVATSKAGSFSIPLTAQADGRWTTNHFPTANLEDVIKGGRDYDLQLSGTLRAPKLFTKPNELLVISLPKWMNDVGVASATYQEGEYKIQLKSKAFSERVDLADVDPLGLLEGKQTAIDTNLDLLVHASVNVAANAAKPIVEVSDASLKVTLFGEVLADYSLPTNLQIQSNLNKSSLEFDGSITVSNRNPISLGSLGAPFNQTFQLPAPIVSAVGTATAGVATVRGNLQVGTTPGPVIANYSFQLDTINDALVWNRNGTYVEVNASMEARASVAAGIEVLSIAGLPPIASLTVSGGLNAQLAAQIRVDAGGPLAAPVFRLNREESGATLGMYYDVDVVGNILFDTIEIGRFQYTSGNLAPIQLLGNKQLPVAASTETGTGISTNPPSPPAPPESIFLPLAFGPTSRVAVGSALASEFSAPQGTLRLSSSISPAVQHMDLGFSVYSNQASLTPGNHRLDFVMVGTTSEVILHTIDLADLSYSPQATEPMLTSGVLNLQLTPEMGTLDPSQLYQLELRLFSDAVVGGESTHVQLLDFSAALPPAQLALTTQSGAAEDGRLEFGPETIFSPSETVSIVNTGSVSTFISQIDLQGTGFEWEIASRTPLLLVPGQAIPVSIRVTDPQQVGAATLRVYGTSDEQMLGSLELVYDPQQPVDVLAPSIAAIELRSTQWGAATNSVSVFSSPLAHANLNQLAITFSEDVIVGASDLLLHRGEAGTLQATEFHYDPNSHVAVWTYPELVEADLFSLELRPGISDLAFNPLPLLPALAFKIMPGNADGDGLVGFADFVRVSNGFGTINATALDGDFNGDRIVDFADFVILSNQFGLDSASFIEPNLAPLFTRLPLQLAAAGTLAEIELEASDANTGDLLTYSLKAGPAGAVVDPTSGRLTFPTPSELGGMYHFVVTVQDDASAPAFDEMIVSLEARPANSAPTIVPYVGAEVRHGAPLFMQLDVDDANLPLDKFSFELVAGAPGMVLNATTGVLTWNPGLDVAPGVYEVRVRVTDSLTPPLSDLAEFSVRVLPNNVRPSIVAPPSIEASEHTQFGFQATASDPNLYDNLTFSLGVGAPAGATIDPVTGWFSWTPDESQGPQLHAVTLIVRDDGAEMLSDSIDVLISVNEHNTAPTILDPGLLLTSAGEDLSVALAAEDADLPLNQLHFVLEAAPPGLSLDESSGLLQWATTAADIGTHQVTVRVHDDGLPPLQSSLTITIQVGAEQQAPIIYAYLPQGVSGTSAQTADFAGSIDETGSVVSFVAGLNNMPSEQWIDVLGYLDLEKEFTLPASLLEQLNNGPLAEGNYTLHLRAIDAQGLIGTLDFEFAIDTTPSTITLELLPEFDSGIIGDLVTHFGTVTFVGQAEPHTIVEADSEFFYRSYTDATGRFLVPDIELPLGVTTLDFWLMDGAGNQSFQSVSVHRILDDGTLGPDAFGYQALVQPAQFRDISHTGTPILEEEDNAEWWLGDADLNGFTFRFYGVDYDELYIGTNGTLAFGPYLYYYPDGSGWIEYANQPLIAPLWTDLIVSGSADSAIYYQITGPEGGKELIVQWHQVRLLGSDETVTFQAILNQLDSSITFNYLDLDYGVEPSEAHEFVGIKPASQLEATKPSLQLSRRSMPNQLVGNGLSTRIEIGVPDISAPFIFAEVIGSYGYPIGTNPTNDLMISGWVLDAAPITLFSGGFAPVLPSEFQDLLAYVQDDGTFTLTSWEFEEILGASLPEGPGTLFLRAQDIHGNVSQYEVPFLIDLTPPSMTLNLLPEFDSGSLGDLETSFDSVTLEIRTEPYTEVSTLIGGYFGMYYANFLGQILIPDVELALGNNPLEFTLTDDAGNVLTYSSSIQRVLDGDTLGSDAFGDPAVAQPAQFYDFGHTGTQILEEEQVDDAERWLGDADLDSLPSRFYGVDEDDLYAATGTPAIEPHLLSYPNGYEAYDSIVQPLMPPLWTDLIVAESAENVIDYHVTAPQGARGLIVQFISPTPRTQAPGNDRRDLELFASEDDPFDFLTTDEEARHAFGN